jgi:hypothetical protein
MGLLSDFRLFGVSPLTIRFAGHSARGGDTADLLPTHASKAWSFFGRLSPYGSWQWIRLTFFQVDWIGADSFDAPLPSSHSCSLV